MHKFYDLKIAKINRETIDSVSIEFEIPEALKSSFAYKQGQYLTFKIMHNGQELRRSYSICSSPYNGQLLKVAVKEVEGGVFSAFANRSLKAGEVLATMPPAGKFYTELSASNAKKYVAFAAGSGITPVLSIVKSVLLVEKNSSVHLFYGNKDSSSVIFKAELDKLAAEYKNLTITYIYSREKNNNPLTEGRIDKTKAIGLTKEFNLQKADEFFICGPEEMIIGVSEALSDLQVDKKKVHFELFTTPVKMKSDAPVDTGTDSGTFSGVSMVTTIMDGMETTFELSGKGQPILDAAIDAGVDAPFSCKGAVCCTCKAKVLSGKVHMNMNYALSEDEVNQGYILTCQAHPLSDKLTVDFDV